MVSLDLTWSPPRGSKFGESGKGRAQARPKRRWDDAFKALFDDHPEEWTVIALRRQDWKSFE
eukprot:8650948-Karenia_brevis.AAC.1